MKIILDRRGCPLWNCACESDFSSHYLGPEVIPTYCLLEMIDDACPERTFVIKDKDGVDKVLVVDQQNWADAHDSWFLAWEKQQTNAE